jgi:hypothetical protein
MTEGVACLEFERVDRSLERAIRSAIADIEGSGTGVRVVRVESEAANTIAKINASLLGVPSANKSEKGSSHHYGTYQEPM